MLKKYSPLTCLAALLCVFALPVQAQEQPQPGSIDLPEDTAKSAALPAASEEEINQWVNVGKNYYAGVDGFMRQDYTKAREHFEKAAEYKHPEALYYLGNIYQDGLDVTADEETALDYYRRAAELEHPDSQMIIGVQHVMDGVQLDPQSIEQNAEYAAAVEWLKKAAAQQVPEAKFWYGDMLIKGLGTEKNETRGVQLVREAAEAENPNGQAMLGALHWHGQAGVNKDLIVAYKWMFLARENGNENAAFLLKRIRDEMDDDQLTAARKAIREAEKTLKSNNS